MPSKSSHGSMRRRRLALVAGMRQAKLVTQKPLGSDFSMSLGAERASLGKSVGGKPADMMTKQLFHDI